MPLYTDESWSFVCGVCGTLHRSPPGTHPDGWRRLTVSSRLDAATGRVGAPLEAWRAARYEDWVCSPGCAVAAVLRSWDPPRQRALRAHELDAIAARVVA